MTKMLMNNSGTTILEQPIAEAPLRRRPIDNALAVETPENIAFDYRVAGPFQRLISLMIDFFVVQTLYWIVVSLSFFVLAAVGATVGAMGELLVGFYLFLTLVGAFIVYWFYGATMETLYHGRTWGKMICGQRVLDTSGSSITASQALVRNFFRGIDTAPIYMLPITLAGSEAGEGTLPIPTALFGLIAMCCTRDYRRVGDLLAGTIVVREEKRVAAKLVQFTDPRVWQLAELIPASFTVDRPLARALAAYVQRRDQLGPDRCDEIAHHLTVHLTEPLGLMPDTNPDLLLCALYYRVHHDRSSAGETSPPSWPIGAASDVPLPRVPMEGERR